MRYDLIKTGGYLLAVTDDKVEKDDYGLVFNEGIDGFGRGYFIFKHDGGGSNKLTSLCSGTKKIIAHLPLNDSKYLDGLDTLPNIPNPSEENVSYSEEWKESKGKYRYTSDDMIEFIKYVQEWRAKSESFEDFTKDDRDLLESFNDSLDEKNTPIYFERKINEVLGDSKVVDSRIQWIGKYIF
jgi:hypothetical protein